MSAVSEFVDLLRLERLRRRLRRADVARDLGITGQALAGWENFRYTPTDANLRRWAQALGVPVPNGVRGFPDAQAVCGTLGGHARHRRLGEPICADCRRAMAEYMREYRSRPIAGPP